MQSLFDELTAKLARDPRLTKKGGARYDLGLLLFSARDALRALWSAADDAVRSSASEGEQPSAAPLAAAVESLRPIFGERPDR